MDRSAAVAVPHGPGSPHYWLRAAAATDQMAIRQLVRAAGINPLGLNWRRFTLAVDADNVVVGCGQIKPHADGSRELASIAVTPAWRGRGVAGTIIRHLMDRSEPPLWLTCRTTLVGFYHPFGFREVLPDETLPAYFSRIRFWSTLLGRLVPPLGRLSIMVWRPANSE